MKLFFILLPHVFALLALVSMFVDRTSELVKFTTICLCFAASASFLLLQNFKFDTQPKATLFCAAIWFVNGLINTGYFLHMISRMP